MFGQINRLEPQGRPQDYTTFGGRMPTATHSRLATCDEYACPMKARGWETKLAEADPQQAEGIRWIRTAPHGRVFTEVRGDDAIVTFTFTPGQDCFANGRHRVPNGRPEILLVARGDWRESERPQVVGLSEWKGRLGDHVEQLITARERG